MAKLYTGLDLLNAAAGFEKTVLSDLDQRNAKVAEFELNSMRNQLESDLYNEYNRMQQSNDWEKWPDQMNKFLGKLSQETQNKDSKYFCRNPYTAQKANQMFESAAVDAQQKVHQLQWEKQKEHNINTWIQDIEALRINNIYGPQEKYNKAYEAGKLLYEGGVISESQFYKQMDTVYSMIYTDAVTTAVSDMFDQGITDGKYFASIWADFEANQDKLIHKDLAGLEKPTDTKALNESLKKTLAYQYEARIQDVWDQNYRSLEDIFQQIGQAETYEQKLTLKRKGNEVLSKMNGLSLKPGVKEAFTIKFWIDEPKIGVLKDGEGKLSIQLDNLYKDSVLHPENAEKNRVAANKLMEGATIGVEMTSNDFDKNIKRFTAPEVEDKELYNKMLRLNTEYDNPEKNKDAVYNDVILTLDQMKPGVNISQKDYEDVLKKVASLFEKQNKKNQNENFSKLQSKANQIVNESNPATRNNLRKEAMSQYEDVISNSPNALSEEQQKYFTKMFSQEEIKPAKTTVVNVNNSTGGGGNSSSSKKTTTTGSDNYGTEESDVEFKQKSFAAWYELDMGSLITDTKEGKLKPQQVKDYLKMLAEEHLRRGETSDVKGPLTDDNDIEVAYTALGGYTMQANFLNKYLDSALGETRTTAVKDKINNIYKDLEKNKDKGYGAETTAWVTDAILNMIIGSPYTELDVDQLYEDIDKVEKSYYARKVDDYETNNRITRNKEGFIDYKSDKQEDEYIGNMIENLKDNPVFYIDDNGARIYKNDKEKTAVENMEKELTRSLAGALKIEPSKLKVEYEKTENNKINPIPIIKNPSTGDKFTVETKTNNKGKVTGYQFTKIAKTGKEESVPNWDIQEEGKIANKQDKLRAALLSKNQKQIMDTLIEMDSVENKDFADALGYISTTPAVIKKALGETDKNKLLWSNKDGGTAQGRMSLYDETWTKLDTEYKYLSNDKNKKDRKYEKREANFILITGINWSDWKSYNDKQKRNLILGLK